jgi:hypothetical protein
MYFGISYSFFFPPLLLPSAAGCLLLTAFCLLLFARFVSVSRGLLGIKATLLEILLSYHCLCRCRIQDLL